jgi:hypothetical protein
MNRTMILVALAAAAMLAGCRTKAGVRQQDAYARAMHAWGQQERDFKSVDVVGTNMTINLTGVTSFTLRAPHNPLPAPVRPPTGMEMATDLIKSVAPYAAIGILGMFETSPAQVTTYVSSPAPTPVVAPVEAEPESPSPVPLRPWLR